jgi:hypothetical protein
LPTFACILVIRGNDSEQIMKEALSSRPGTFVSLPHIPLRAVSSPHESRLRQEMSKFMAEIVGKYSESNKIIAEK